MKLADEIKLNAGGPGSGRKPGEGPHGSYAEIAAHLSKRGYQATDFGNDPNLGHYNVYSHPTNGSKVNVYDTKMPGVYQHIDLQGNKTLGFGLRSLSRQFMGK